MGLVTRCERTHDTLREDEYTTRERAVCCEKYRERLELKWEDHHDSEAHDSEAHDSEAHDSEAHDSEDLSSPSIMSSTSSTLTLKVGVGVGGRSLTKRGSSSSGVLTSSVAGLLSISF